MKTIVTCIFLCRTVFLQGQAWHELPDFPGTGRDDGAGIVCNGKGYFGTGFGTGFIYLNDWWQYDFETGNWTPKTALPGQPRDYAGIAAIGSDIYVLGGYTSSGCIDELWKYRTAEDNWEMMAHFPGGGRQGMVLQALNGKLYAGMGRCDTIYHSDLWEFDPVALTWKELTPYPGGQRFDPIQAVVNEQLIIGAGVDYFSGHDDCYEYSPLTGNWKQVNDFPGCSHFYTTQYTDGNKMYLVNGCDTGYEICNDALVYTSGLFDQRWTPLLSDPMPFKRRGGVGFLYNNRLYYVSGLDTQYNHLQNMLYLDLQDQSSGTGGVFNYRLYPNPTSDYVILETHPAFDVSRLKLFDDLFRQVPLQYAAGFQQYFRIDFSALKPGIYFLYDTGGKFLQKICKH